MTIEWYTCTSSNLPPRTFRKKIQVHRGFRIGMDNARMTRIYNLAKFGPFLAHMPNTQESSKVNLRAMIVDLQ